MIFFYSNLFKFLYKLNGLKFRKIPSFLLLPWKVIEFSTEWKTFSSKEEEEKKIKILSKLWKIGERIEGMMRSSEKSDRRWMYLQCVCEGKKNIQFGFCGILQENDRNQCTVEINFPGIWKTFSSPLFNNNDSEKKTSPKSQTHTGIKTENRIRKF